MNKLTLFALAAVSVLLVPQFAQAGFSADEALDEYERALSLNPNLDNGRELYQSCAVCHDPEGWGRKSGIYPQIAGQLPNVIIKQLADIRAGNRGNPMMYPFTTERILKDAQDIADVAAYVSELPMTVDNGRGSRARAERGLQLYLDNCADCHGENGEGNNEEHIPQIASQHYRYLVRQFNWIRIGRRKNADDEMVEQIQTFRANTMYDVLAYASFLQPPAAKIAAEDWQNPDFYAYSRDDADQLRSSVQKVHAQESKEQESYEKAGNTED